MEPPTIDETLLYLDNTRLPMGQRRAKKGRCRAGRTRWRGSSMIENFNEFLASRNVINQTSSYDKITNEPNEDAIFSSSSINSVQQLGGSASLQLNAAELNHMCLGQNQKSTAPPLKIIASLITGKERNKSVAFIRLIRAPAVLGALFSLALTVSLITLYTMTYHAHILSLSSYHLGSAGDEMCASSEEVVEDALRRALTVQTECGPVVGELEDRAIAFRGIPYATPPIGKRRWRRPQPVWLDRELCGQLNTTLAGGQKLDTQGAARDHCIQLSPFKRRITGSEDCLYLDIYSAQLDSSKKLPVMLYIHGGFLAFGSSGRAQVNWMKARPSGELASELNVVLVAFNFRLQALGFVSPTPPGFRESSTDSSGDISAANYGLWDQLVALKWVKRNIEAFGGDPNNVIIFGPDSASALPLALMTQHSQQTEDMDSPIIHENLFRAAWLTNPTVFFEQKKSATTTNRLGGSMLDSNVSHCSLKNNQTDQLKCLQDLSAEQVIQAYLANEDPTYRLDDQNSMPVHGVFASQLVSIDGELVQDAFPFQKAISESTFHVAGKDLLIGSSAQAVEYWACPRNFSQWSKYDLEHYTSTSLASFHVDTYKEAHDLYTSQSNEISHLSQDELARLTYLNMVSDIRQICPTNLLENRLRDLGHSVKRYTVETPYQGERTSSSVPHHAFHYWDLIVFFGYQFDERFEPNSADLMFQKNIRSMVKQFAHGSLEDNAGYILFKKDASVSTEPHQKRQKECNMWQARLGLKYSWTS